MDPSLTGLIIGLTAGGVLIVVVIIGVAATCYVHKHKSQAIIIANLRARRIHVLQTAKPIPPSTRASTRSIKSIHRNITTTQISGKADVRTVRAVSRSAGTRKKSVSESADRQIKSADAKKRHMSGSAIKSIEFFTANSTCATANATPIPIPMHSSWVMPVNSVEQSTFKSPNQAAILPPEPVELMPNSSTSQKVFSFESFDKRRTSWQSPRDLQETSIMIDPQANMQTTIILDDTSSVATTLPYVN